MATTALGSRPYYDTTEAEMEKGYAGVVFTPGKAVQSRELTGIGSYARENSKKIVNLMYKSGTIITGCAIQSIDKENATATLTSGTIVINGEVYDIDFDKNTDLVSNTVPIKVEGTETIFVEVVTSIVEADSDSSLVDPSEGYDNYEEAGAARLRKVARYISTSSSDYSSEDNASNPRVTLYTLLNGEVLQDKTATAENTVTEEKPAASSSVDMLDVVASRNYETLGNYLVEGFQVKVIDCADATKIGIQVDSGVAYVNGFRREIPEKRNIYLKKHQLKQVIGNEDHVIDNTIDTYKLNLSPVIAADVYAPIKATTQMIYSTATNNTISAPTGAVYRVLKVYTEGTSGKEYVEGTDYSFSGNTISWISAGDHPASQFKVDYTYKAVLDPSKYSLSYSGLYEKVLKLPVSSLGIVEIPSQYLNPCISSIEDSSNSGVYLTKGTDWYQQGNKIKIVTSSNAVLPVEITRAVGSVDNLGIIDGEVQSLSYYTENGEVMYEAQSPNSSEDYDYTFSQTDRTITWNGTKDRHPAAGEVYIANVRMPDATSSYDYVNVRFSYESAQDLYTNRVYDTYLTVDTDSIVGKTSSDTITVDATVARTRKDSICIDRDGNLVVVHGTILGDDGIYETRPSTSLLKIADVVVKPTSARDVAIYQANTYRVRMQDMREMFNKVKDIDYNISLTTLESYAESLASSTTLRGIVTDPFTSLSMIDAAATINIAGNGSHFATPNIADALLYPGFSRYATPLEVNAINTTAGKKGDVYVLSAGSVEVPWLQQLAGTSTRSLAEGVYSSLLFPQLEISPDSDYFVAGAAALTGDDTDDYLIIPQSMYAYVLERNAYLSANVAADSFSDGNMTVEFWFQIQDRNATPLFTAEGSGLTVYAHQDNIYVKNGANAAPLMYATGENLAEGWHHLALVYSGNTIQALYFDGEVLKYTPTTYITVYPYTGPVAYLGITTNDTTAVKFGGGFEVGLANIRIFNSARTESQIRTYMLAEVVPDENGILGYYEANLSATGVANSAVADSIGDLVMSGTISSVSIKLDDVTDENPVVSTDYITNTIDLTKGNVKPQGTSTTTLTGTKVSTSISTSRWFSRNHWTYGWHETTTTKTTTTKTYSREDVWYTRDTETQVEDYGTFLTDVSAALTLRRRKIVVHGSGLLSYTDPIEITFNGEKVNLFAEATGGLGSKSTTYGCWTADENGEFVAAFVIPANVPVGVREVAMNIPGGPTAKATYWGAGNIVEKTNLEVETDTIYWKENRSTTTWSSSSSTSISSDRCVSRCYTCPLAQTIYVNDPNTCTPVMDDYVEWSDVEVTSVDIYVREFNATSQFFVGFIELTDSGYPSASLDRWTSEVKTFTGADLNATGDYVHGTTAYNVRFDTPIKLKGGKGYALVVGSPDQKSRIWVAKIGETTPTINGVEGETIHDTRDRGMLLSSPNSKTWIAYIDEDMKYSIYINDYFASGNLTDVDPSLSLVATSTTGKKAVVEYKEVVFATASENVVTYPNFFLFDVMYSTPEDQTGYITFEYAAKVNGAYGSWIEFTPGMLVEFDSPADAIKIRANIYSFNRYSSPTIDSGAALTIGQFNLPAYYVSRTVDSGRYNRVNLYIDEFFDPALSEIVVKYSPDGGYTWRTPSISKLEPLSLSSEAFGDNVILYQYCLEDGLTLAAPEVTNIALEALSNGDTSGNFVAGKTYAITYALKDIYDRESPLSEEKTFVAESGKAPRVTLKFDPNATGFAVYVRNVTDNGTYFLWYDSTKKGTLKSNITATGSSIVIGSEGRLFPNKGVVIIGTEYIQYSGKTSDASGDYTLTTTKRGYTNLGAISSADTHAAGDTVILADHCLLNRGTITGTISDLWKFGNYTVEKDEDTGENYYLFSDLVVDKGLNTTSDDIPQYDPSYPASFESEKLSYMIKLDNLEDTSTIGRPDLIPTVGRLIINTSYEAY